MQQQEITSGTLIARVIFSFRYSSHVERIRAVHIVRYHIMYIIGYLLIGLLLHQVAVSKHFLPK